MCYCRCGGSKEIHALHLAWLWLRSVPLEGRTPIRWYRRCEEVASFGTRVSRGSDRFVLILTALAQIQVGENLPYWMESDFTKTVQMRKVVLGVSTK